MGEDWGLLYILWDFTVVVAPASKFVGEMGYKRKFKGTNYLYQFYAEIFKFSVILTHMELFFFGGGEWVVGKKMFWGQIPPPCSTTVSQ